MLINLSMKNKLGFVNGSIPKPTSTLFDAWKRCNNMLISWLLGVLDQSTARNVLRFATVSEIWSNLEERSGQSSGTQLFSVKGPLNDIKQGQDSISGYYTKLKMLWNQLDSTDPIPICECKNCSYSISRKPLKSQQDRRLMEFMM